jgi:hypothetical protein
MSGDVKAAIAETVARAKELRLGPNGSLKGSDQFAALFTMQMLLPSVTKVQELNAFAGSLLFDWRGSTLVYRKDRADVLIDGANGDAFIDKVLCGAAAIILDALGGIPDARLRSYVCGRLMGGLTPLTKRRRGQKKADNSYRDAVIAGWLIPPLLDRFNATRNAETRHAESACSISTTALAHVGVHISEKRLENIWAKVAHLHVPTKYPI